MIDIKPRPDFGRFLDTLTLREAYRRPPMFDFGIAPVHKAAVVGHEVKTPQDEVDFWRLAGYDYVQFVAHIGSAELQAVTKHSKGGSAHYEDAVISSLDQFRSRQWSWQAAAGGDLSCLAPRLERAAQIAKAMPAEMKIIVHVADIFTYAWQMIGFTNFAIMTMEQPELIHEVMASLADAQINSMRAAIDAIGDNVGAIFYSDDIAYTEGLMMSPAFYEKELFPCIRRIADLGTKRNLPLIYHTDGKLYEVFDQLAAAGVRGIQPLEPKSMDPLEIKRRWPGKFCLMGNIDLDLLGRGEVAQVRAHVRDRVDKLNVGGGYMPGVSNTVPFYVKFENYKCMIETVYSYE